MVEQTIRFKYPANLGEATTRQYMKWVEVVELLFKDGEENVNMNELVRQKISIFCNIPLSAVDMIPVEEILDVSEHLTRLLSQDQELTTSFKLGDTEFRILPNFETMSFGEFVDASDFLKDPKDYHRLISVFYREVEEIKHNDILNIEQYRIKPYNSETAKEYATKFLDIPATVVTGLTFFLLSSFEELQILMKDYLEEERMRIMLSEGVDLAKSGDGFTASTD